MENRKVEGRFDEEAGVAEFNLLLMEFVDENAIHFIYTPHLDLSGYGKTQEEAFESFEVALNEFLSYTREEQNLARILMDLGWKVEGQTGQFRRAVAPAISTLIKRNSYISEIFDNYPVHTFYQSMGLSSVAA